MKVDIVKSTSRGVARAEKEWEVRGKAKIVQWRESARDERGIQQQNQ